MSAPSPETEGRVLVLFSDSSEADRLRAALADAAIDCYLCTDSAALCEQILEDAGAVLLSDDVLSCGLSTRLAAILDAQPAWSEIQLIVLVGNDTNDGAFSPLAYANTVRIDRTVGTASLVGIVQAAIRARLTQYRYRDLLDDRRSGRDGSSAAASIPPAREETERERLSESLRLALDAADLGTWDWDPVTDAITLSERGAQIYGVDGGRTYAREWMRELLHPDYRDEARARAAQSVAERSDYDMEYPLNGRDGEPIWVSARGRGVYDSNGTLIRMLGVVQDVTSRKRAESTLRTSEERYRQLVNATSDVVYQMSPDWEEMQPLDGRNLVPSSAEPLRGWMQQNLPEFEHRRVTEAIDRAIAEKSTFELEHQVFRTDGSIGWIYSRAVPILDSLGNIAEWFGTARDITLQRRTEVELASVTAESDRLRRLYETVLSGTPDFIYVFSLDHRVLYANDALLVMWGLDRDQVIGKTFLEIGYEPWHAELHGREIDQVRATKQPIRGEVPFVGTHGRRIYDYIFVPVIGVDGEVEAVAGTTRDVTDRKEMEDALRETDRKKDDFIALLAHELRNPLAPIRNGLQVIRLSDDEKTRARAQQMMDRQLRHMVRLIDDLLDVSRIGRNKMDLRSTTVRLAEVIHSAVETSRPAIEEAGHELIVTLPSDTVVLDADLTRLSQVFSNLLSNSAKYTDRGGTIFLSAEYSEGCVVVTVRDTGIGIPLGSLPTIFDMFSQVDRPAERSSGGLGIGLALVKGLVEMHRGTVAARSDGNGLGSEFAVTLPARLGELEVEGQFGESVPNRSNGTLRILVVDDNRDGAESLATMLELSGNTVAMAFDGIEAVERAERFRPEIIFMDVGMPRLNGLDATKEIRRREWGRAITIVALTGWGQEADRERSREAGCSGHLVKPVSWPDLERVLESARR